jgi:hypothetical protein
MLWVFFVLNFFLAIFICSQLPWQTLPLKFGIDYEAFELQKLSDNTIRRLCFLEILIILTVVANIDISTKINYLEYQLDTKKY